MLKLKKIIETILIFIITMLGICFLFSLFSFFQKNINVEDIISRTGLYFLYTIGYGSLEKDTMIQNILAIIGIVALALMSTYLTINLFWRLDDVKLKKEFIVDKKSNLIFEFLNKGRTICDMKAIFMINKENYVEDKEQKEYYIPIVFKKSKWKLTVNLEDAFWYKAISNLYLNPSHKLYCMYSFVDTKNGQGSIKVEEIKKEHLKNISLEYFTKPIQLSNFSCCSSNKVKIETLENQEYLYHFPKNANPKDFAMVFLNYNYHVENFQKYNENSYFKFTLLSKKEMTITLQIKGENGCFEKDYLVTDKLITYELALKDITIPLDKIKEICFTIFKEKNSFDNTFIVKEMILNRKN